MAHEQAVDDEQRGRTRMDPILWSVALKVKFILPLLYSCSRSRGLLAASACMRCERAEAR